MTPTVSIIVTHHLIDNQKYLDLCLNSVMKQVGVSFEVFCVSSAERAPLVPNGVKLIHDTKLNNSTKKIDYALHRTHPESKHFLLLSDDVMLTCNTLSQMVNIADQFPCIQNPACNGDVPGKYLAEYILRNQKGEVLHLATTLNREDISGWENLILDYPRSETLLVPFNFVSFYCTLIPRQIWKEVGSLDPVLDLKNNDVDYCLRAAQKGYTSFVNFGAFCLHFGSKTLNVVKTKTDDQAADEYFATKWSANSI